MRHPFERLVSAYRWLKDTDLNGLSFQQFLQDKVIKVFDAVHILSILFGDSNFADFKLVIALNNLFYIKCM